MSDDYQNFASHPTSLGERRATKATGGAGLWTPREALVAALRAIDSGEIEPDQVAVIVTEEDGDGTTRMQYFQSCKSTLELLGMYQTAASDTLGRSGPR